jgi:hypothetical protein
VVALIRLRNSVSSASGVTGVANGRIAVAPVSFRSCQTCGPPGWLWSPENWPL